MTLYQKGREIKIHSKDWFYRNCKQVEGRFIKEGEELCMFKNTKGVFGEILLIDKSTSNFYRVNRKDIVIQDWMINHDYTEMLWRESREN